MTTGYTARLLELSVLFSVCNAVSCQHSNTSSSSLQMRSRLFFSLLSQVQKLLFFKYQLLVRSSLVTRSSAPPDGCQPRPDAALTEPVQLDNLIQLS